MTAAATSGAGDDGAAPTVVLLHGLARRAGSLAGLGRACRAAGLPTFACDYPSRRRAIADAAAELADRLARELPGRPLAAITHSLGGIVVRHLADPRLDWRRIAMLAPPNRGSQVAEAFAGSPLFRWFYGPAGVELAAPDPSGWPPPPAPFVVVAGTRRRALINPTSWVSGRVFGPDQDHDGTVAVDETCLAGMAGLARVDAAHTVIMNHPVARDVAIRFVRDGAVPG